MQVLTAYNDCYVIHTDSSGHVKQWHPATGKTLSLINEERQTLVGRYAPDVSTFSTSGSDHKILVYDASTCTLIKTLEQR